MHTVSLLEAVLYFRKGCLSAVYNLHHIATLFVFVRQFVNKNPLALSLNMVHSKRSQMSPCVVLQSDSKMS